MKRLLFVTLMTASFAVPASADSIVEPASERFAAEDATETPHFRMHVVPLMGKLGCNGRACHGSFQGQGGFRLSLFGYDFEMDHKGLTEADPENDKEARVDHEYPEESLMLEKPTLLIPHRGGKRMDVGSWQHRLLLNWIKGGAKNVGEDDAEFVRLDVTPSEILFDAAGKKQPLRVIAVWSDGTREDVTPLCRFQSNDDQVAEIDEAGMVTAKNSGDTHVVVFYDAGVVPIPVIRPHTELAGANYPKVVTPTMVDQLVVDKLRKLGMVPSDLSEDAEFLRRVSLDLTGSLPSPAEVVSFLQDRSADKRSRKIDELLERPTYAAWWTTRLCDITGNNDDSLANVTPVRSTGSQEWYDWLYKRVASNVPYDEIVAGIVTATSRNTDEEFTDYVKAMTEIYKEDGEGEYADRQFMPHYWARRTVRLPEERAISFAYTFMGIRIQCAQCHKHPFDRWTQDDFEQFSGFFGRERFTYGINPKSRDKYNELLETFKEETEELNGGQVRRFLSEKLQEGKMAPVQELYAVAPRKPSSKKGSQDKGPTAKLLGGAVVALNDHDDARLPLMDWLRSRNNDLFAKAFVNRVWATYFNVGIVEPPDDLSLANPPSNGALLDYLAESFIEHDYDMKWLHREIANSRTYQASWRPNETNRLDQRNFSHSIPRRLPAEVAYDAVQQATASDSETDRMLAEIKGRAIAIPGANGRNRSTRGPQYALTIFGRSTRESNCDCDRSTEASLLQTVFLQNDQDVFSMIDRKNVSWISQVEKECTEEAAPVAEAKPEPLPPRAKNQFKRLRGRLEKAKKQKNEELAKTIQKQIAAKRKQFAEIAEKKKAERKEANAVEEPESSVAQLVDRTYLRTLSRLPDEQERERSIAYLESSETPVDGARGLLWALLNTKEFIVNH